MLLRNDSHTLFHLSAPLPIPVDMFRSGGHNEVGEEEVELLPTTVSARPRVDRFWRTAARGFAKPHTTSTIALVGILVFALLLPSPLTWGTSEALPRNVTRPINGTHGHRPPSSESSSLRGTLEWATQENKELISSIFVPLPVRECTITTPAWFAPCAARRMLVPSLYAEELIYPDFGLTLPVFVNDEQRSLWLEAVEKVDRMRYEARGKEEYMLYSGQHGQNFVSHKN